MMLSKLHSVCQGYRNIWLHFIYSIADIPKMHLVFDSVTSVTLSALVMKLPRVHSSVTLSALVITSSALVSYLECTRNYLECTRQLL